MHTLIDLSNQLNDYLQISLFNDFTPNGIQIEGKKEIRKVATAVSSSLNVIDQAVELNVDALIVHHGLFWDKDSYVIRDSKREKIAKLLKSGITLLVYHLPLDAHREVGNNWKAAYDLGWNSLEPFFKMGTQYLGVKGKIPRLSTEAFQKQLEAYYGREAVTALGGKKNIETIALISGGAYRQIDHAIACGVDAYITGNYDEPVWHTAHEGKMNFFAMGHAATEKIGPRALAEYLRRTYNLECHFIDEINPF